MQNKLIAQKSYVQRGVNLSEKEDENNSGTTQESYVVGYVWERTLTPPVIAKNLKGP